MIPYDALETKIRDEGIVNAHAHFDRAFTLTSSFGAQGGGQFN